MNTVPILNSTSNLRMLWLEFATDSMELCKKPAPFKYNLPISHPLKLNKTQQLSTCPFKDTNDQIILGENELLRMSCKRNRTTDMIKFMLHQVIDEWYLVGYSLEMTFMGVWGHSHWILYLILVHYTTSFECMVLGWFYYFAQFYIPFVGNYFFYILVNNFDWGLEQRHLISMLLIFIKDILY
jgi:hypothetical protein